MSETMSFTIREKQAARICGTGIAFPKPPWGRGLLRNEEVLAKFATEGPRGQRSNSELKELATAMEDSLGISRRYWSHEIGNDYRDDSMTTVDLSVEAARQALEKADIHPRSVGAVLAATSTPARVTGANAPQIASALGIHCGAWDVRSGCSGGLLALVQAHVFAALLQAPIVVVAADVFSTLVSPVSPLATLAFGDAAAAAVVIPSGAEGGALLSAVFRSDGSLSNVAGVRGSFPPTPKKIQAGDYLLTGDPEKLESMAPSFYSQVGSAALSAAECTSDDIDLLIPHQTTRPAVLAVAAALNMPLEKTIVSVDAHANCGAPGALLALHFAFESGRCGSAQRIMMAALGGGLAWGAAIFAFPDSSKRHR